jgi:hypothetical protein
MGGELKLLNIDEDLIKLEESDLSNDFVSIACEIDENGVCAHSGLIICFEEQVYYFHYTGRLVLLTQIESSLESENPLFIKKIEIIYEDDVVTFLGHCEKLQKIGVHPNYGFVFNDSYYDSNTKESFLINAEHDITTCVGFCIKVIRGFLFNHNEYLKIDDWGNLDIGTLNPNLLNYINHYLQKYAAENGIEIQDLFDKGELKRIMPSELLTSGFFNDLPIRKSSIDSVIPEIEQYLIKQNIA